MATLICTEFRGLEKWHVFPHPRALEAHLHKDAELELEGYGRFEVEQKCINKLWHSLW